MEEVGLIKKVTQTKKIYFYIEGFEQNQNLRRDRQPNTILDFKLSKNGKDSWNRFRKTSYGCHWYTVG
jgi:hypothetical protein